LLFLALMLAQAAHSIEECRFRLFDVWPPARWVASLVSSDLPLGFAVANVLLVLFGFGCYLVSGRAGRRSATAWAWFWTVLEAANGIGHLAVAAARGGYFPGAATTPFLLAISAWLGITLSAGRRS
jgi:uncharacterized protein with HXXEE motif